MSLVHEALEKAAREKQRRTGSSTAAAADTPVAVAAPRPVSPRWVGAIATTVAVILVLWIALWWLYLALDTPAPQPAAQPAAAAAVAPAPAVLPSAPVEEPRYKLTGIVRMPEGEYSAVVNGKAVFESHYVDGAIVRQIERDRVTLDVEGRTLVLRLY